VSALADLRVERAGAAELRVASEVLVEAARWLIDRGQPLWKPEDLVPDRLRAEAEGGLLFVAWQGGEAVGTIVRQWEDRLFWPELTADDSVFIHRLAVRRAFAGTGVAAALLAWAEEQGRDAGREWLRLDCSAEHPGLASYYEGAGFERHSERRLGGFRFLRYQKALRVDSRGWTASPPNVR
jgi:GNAT superfamily N-acetyltransferase